MKATTLDNMRRRHKWLQQVIEHEVLPSKTQIHGIATMRAFCKLEVSEWFPPIALNTLKHAASPCISTKGFENFWYEIKDLRVRAFALHTPKASLSTTAPLPSWKDQAEIALLEAHISTIAYFDIYNYLMTLSTLSSQDAQEILHSIKIKLETSKAKYQSFLLHHSTMHSGKLHMIKGGKDYGH